MMRLEDPPPPTRSTRRVLPTLVDWLNTVAPSDVGPSRLTLYQATLYALPA